MSFEIIPNWHPIFVHFSIALLSISTVLLIVGKIAPQKFLWKNTALIVSKWNLFIGAAISILTVLAGWYAYGTVNHDEPSHLAMTSHMKWALSTFALFVVVATWSFISRKKETGIFLTAFQVIATLSLLITGFKGGELVYRHGLGVLSLPEAEANEGHEHHHDHGSHEHKKDGDSLNKDAVTTNKASEEKTKVTKKVSKKPKAQNKDSAINNEAEKESEHHHDHGDHSHE